MSARAYKVRRFQNGRGRDGTPFYNYALTIPTDIAKELPEDMQYLCEPTDEGILFRPIEGNRKVELPAWAQKSKNGTPKKSRPRPGAKA